MKNNYDFAILGAGISAAYTLIHYITFLEQNPPEKPVRMVVIEKSPDFWTGVPYGHKSGKNPLIITSLKEFIPQLPERDHFKAWLNENRKLLVEQVSQKGGTLSAEWLKIHKVEIENGDWDGLYLPRFIFGKYIREYVDSMIATANDKKLLTLTCIQANIGDVEREGDGFQVTYTSKENGEATLFSDKVIVSIGSPPNAGFANALAVGSQKEANYMADIYEPSLDVNVEGICKILSMVSDPEKRQILIIGSNASTLDVIYALNNSQEASALIRKIIVLSPNGAFPHKINQVQFSDPYEAKNLVSLAKSESFTAKEILLAVQKDVAEANAVKLNIADIFPEISRSMLAALNLLNIEEQKKFVSVYAIEIGKMQRRAGHEYLEVVDKLIADGRFEFVKGRFKSYISSSEGGPGCIFTEPESGESKTLAGSIAVVITCAGFQNVADSSSALIHNLIKKEICTPNDSMRGFLINEQFETSKNCYLMGPLVAGNLVGNFRVWHAESCSRIINMSKDLAGVLLQKNAMIV